jgi:hypothetical protein
MFVLAGSGILISGRTGVKAGCQCHRSYDGDTPLPSIFSPAVVRIITVCRAVIITNPLRVKAIA